LRLLLGLLSLLRLLPAAVCGVVHEDGGDEGFSVARLLRRAIAEQHDAFKGLGLPVEAGLALEPMSVFPYAGLGRSVWAW